MILVKISDNVSFAPEHCRRTQTWHLFFSGLITRTELNSVSRLNRKRKNV